MLELAVDEIERGSGVIALEESKDKEKPVAIMTLRNKIGALVLQGQLMKNVSKLLKKKAVEPNKIERIVTIIGDKEEKLESGEVKTKKALLKCTITFKEEKDCEEFKEAFKKIMAELPEIIKITEAKKP